MSFNNFWKWLCLQGRVISNLGNEAEFAICTIQLDGIAMPLKKGKKHPFTIRDVKIVWDYYYTLPLGERHKPNNFVVPNLKGLKDQCCGPYFAAAIRDFEAGKTNRRHRAAVNAT